MADIATVSESLEMHVIKAAVSQCEGVIKVIPLGHHAQHPSAGGAERVGVITARAGMEHLSVCIGCELDPDGIAFAGGIGLAGCCCHPTGAAAGLDAERRGQVQTAVGAGLEHQGQFWA